MTDHAAPPSTRKIVIVGAGAAGVFTAYRLRTMYGDAYEIVLLEKGYRVGGNALSRRVEVDGEGFSIDCGAQFFYRNPQASYVQLLEDLGVADDPTTIISAPAGFTIWDRQQDAHLFWIPSQLGGFFKYDLDDWDRLADFGKYLAYSYFLDREDPSNWTLSVDEWLAGLPLLSDEFKRDVIKNFMYQFVSLPRARIGEASALYAVTYFVRNVFGERHVDEPEPDTYSLPGLPVFETYQSLIGLDGIMELALARVGVEAQLGTAVHSVRSTEDGVVVHSSGGPIVADHVVLACDPLACADLLEAGGTTPAEMLTTLRGMEYVRLPISMQRDDTCWMPSKRRYWSPVNTIVDGEHITFSAWFGPLRSRDIDGDAIPVFKSWASPDIAGDCAHEFFRNEHFIPLPTTTFVALRNQLMLRQGERNVWFAGGWTNWFDSQEAALDSATRVADALPGAVAPGTGLERMVAVDHDATEYRLQQWLERIAREAPPEKQRPVADALEDVRTRG